MYTSIRMFLASLTFILGIDSAAVALASPPDFLAPGLREKLQAGKIFNDSTPTTNMEKILSDMACAPKESGLSPEQCAILAKKIAPEFRYYMLFFLKPEVVPTSITISSNLTFLDSSLATSSADIAYLDYKYEDRAFHVAQTGKEDMGAIAICIELRPADYRDTASLSTSINTLYGRYLSEDSKAHDKLKIGNLSPAAPGNYWIMPPSILKNYRTATFGAISPQGACIVFSWKHPTYIINEHTVRLDPGVQAQAIVPEKWFDDYLTH